jgi:multidrug efflux pump subunit AcrA (membrane-fusion protein)
VRLFSRSRSSKVGQLSGGSPGQYNAVFVARRLSKTYRMGDVEVPALRSIDFDIEEGEFEQRTNVVIDIVSPQAQWSALGDGYRVDARIIVYQEEDALKVPTGALFREGDQWAVYVESNGIARRRAITLSRRTGLEPAVAAGLDPGEARYPVPE